MKYVVDTCILNKLVDGLLAPSQLPTDGEFVASHIQIDELNRTKDQERRAQLFLTFATTVKEVVPTETFVIGVSRIGHGKLSDGNLFEKLRKELDQLNAGKDSNTADALVAEIAINNRYTLLTADYHLQEVAKNNGCKVLYWQQK
jgi:predicted nucleic acid-binding protein